jgi:hypothetical protein
LHAKAVCRPAGAELRLKEMPEPRGCGVGCESNSFSRQTPLGPTRGALVAPPVTDMRVAARRGACADRIGVQRV